MSRRKTERVLGVDVGLEEALKDLRARKRRCPRGCLDLRLVVEDGLVAYHRITVEKLTEEDLERVMKQPAGRTL